jgi:hypothetical protein
MPPQPRPRVEVVEPYEDPTWSRPGTFGRRIQLYAAPPQGEQRIPQTAGEAFSVLENTKFPGPPRTRGVHFYRIPDRESSLTNANYRARLTYGASGIVNSAELDWLQGAQFPLVCDTLRVDVVSYAPDGRAAYDPQAAGSVGFGVMLGQVGPGTSRMPTYTTPIQDVAGGTALIARVPDLARVVWPMIVIPGGSGALLTDLFIDMQLNLATLIERANLTDQQTIQQGFVIPGGTVRVRLSNTDTDAVQACFCFGLGF